MKMYAGGKTLVGESQRFLSKQIKQSGERDDAASSWQVEPQRRGLSQLRAISHVRAMEEAAEQSSIPIQCVCFKCGGKISTGRQRNEYKWPSPAEGILREQVDKETGDETIMLQSQIFKKLKIGECRTSGCSKEWMDAWNILVLGGGYYCQYPHCVFVYCLHSCAKGVVCDL